MIPAQVTSAQGVIVVGGGELRARDLERALSIAPTLVAADGGADQAIGLGRIPDWVIGDLDSFGDAARMAIPKDRIIHIAEQDSTDFTKCLTRIMAPFVIAVGFSGRRLDHTLAALTTMAKITKPSVIMLTPDDVAFLAPPRLILPLIPGTRVSLYPMGPATGISTGLEWPIEGIKFSPGGQIGTSNRATGPVKLQIKGQMMVFLPGDCLETVLTALNLTTG